MRYPGAGSKSTKPMKKHFVWITAAAVTGVASMALINPVSEKNLPDASPRNESGAENAEAKEVTSFYLVNPSFEADDVASLEAVNNSADGLRGWKLTAPQGWTVTGIADPTLIITADCFTDNNFGKAGSVTDGSQAFYMRVGWSDGASSLSQKLNLPAGNYRLTADLRTAYNGSATSSYTLRAGNGSVGDGFAQGSANVFGSMGWQTVSVDFANLTEGEVTVALDINWKSGGSCVMIDNVRLYETAGGTVAEDPTEADVKSPTEGVISHDFVSEAQMQSDLLQMLADFSKYMKDDFQNCEAPNSIGEACGCFKGENTMANDERGVRPNADLSMICAFLVKYGKDKVTLPAEVTWDDLETLARKSLVFAYSTHKANKLKVCKGNNYWGSTSKSDNVWESSLWAMSVAYSAFFQWDSLSEAQKGYIKALLKAECNYELERSIPTGYAGDTKAEENGWEADVLAATLGLFPDDELAPKWFARLREFAVNSYSHVSDADNSTVIDPEYDNTTVAQLYKGKNLYDDYTLQNHNLFHTSYQNVVMQELGEAALALKMFQLGLYGTEKWKTNALMHNNQKVMDEVLNWLALADGELAMPNGNDWSLFLFDQITSYSTMACFLGDPNALMLENMAYKYIKARQQTTADGSWLLNADVGARRMGVQGHRVMMTWLMHNELSTAALTPTAWTDFNREYSAAKVLTDQNIVRASTPERFTCFSWSSGLKSYTGYFAPNTPDNNKIIVPYRANNTGNILGWYEVAGKGTNATPVVSGVYELDGDAYTMNGEINTNDGSLNNRFAVYSTPGNAFIYIDYVRANSAVTINRALGGLMAISTDPFMKEKRTLYFGDGAHRQTDGKVFESFNSDWVNIDNALGMVSAGGKKIGFGDRSLNNSINTAKIYPMYADDRRDVKAGEVADARNLVYYSNVDAATTRQLAAATQALADRVAAGWNGVIAPDPDGTNYLILANFASDTRCRLSDVVCAEGAPVFGVATVISEGKSTAEFVAEQNRSITNVLNVFVKGADVTAIQDGEDVGAAYLQNNGNASVKATVTIIADGKVTGEAEIGAGKCVRVSVEDGRLKVEGAEMPATEGDDLTEGYVDVTGKYIENASFEEDVTYSKIGSAKVGSGTYDPCYINDVAALQTNYPNILPVKGWSQTNTLNSPSGYCRMYSMPYSSTLYCVSEVGNYAAQCPPFLMDEADGERCLTVLDSWATGENFISRSATLPAGEYRLLMNVRYECPNQESNNGREIVASGNVNRSLTGVKVGEREDFRYPAESNRWETLCWDFTTDSATPVDFRIGYGTSKSVGAANNTLLYADHVRLLVKPDSAVDGVMADEDGAPVDVYSIAGVLLRRSVDPAVATAGLAAGLYLVGGRKVAVK